MVCNCRRCCDKKLIIVHTEIIDQVCKDSISIRTNSLMTLSNQQLRGSVESWFIWAKIYNATQKHTIDHDPRATLDAVNGTLSALINSRLLANG